MSKSILFLYVTNVNRGIFIIRYKQQQKSAAITTENDVIFTRICHFMLTVAILLHSQMKKVFIILHSKNVQLTGDFPGINGCVYVYYANEMEIRVCAAITISQVVCKWNGNETIDAHWHAHAIQVFMLNKRIKLLL